MRVACGIEYDGGRFLGWQRQRGSARTVQDAIERALTRVADHPVTVVCAGRTDTGVHATTQVCHFDTSSDRSEKAWVMGTNTALADDVAVRWARPVPSDFHARYAAVARRYRYVLLEGWNRSALWRQRAGWYHTQLDLARMQAAARRLLGEHDFSAFRSSACQAVHALRRLEHIEVRRAGAAIVIDIQGNAFLHNMVRIIVGVLMAVGAGDRPPAWVETLLEHGDRREAGKTAPAQGLYLIGPVYPRRFGLPLPEPPQWPAIPDSSAFCDSMEGT